MLFQNAGRMQIFRRGSVEVGVVRRAGSLGGDTVVIDGVRRHRGAQTFATRVVIFPLSGRDMQMQPEGDRFSEGVKVFQLLRDQTGLVAGDIFTHGERRYQVQTVNNWGPYLEIQAKAVDTGFEGAGRV